MSFVFASFGLLTELLSVSDLGYGHLLLSDRLTDSPSRSDDEVGTLLSSEPLLLCV